MAFKMTEIFLWAKKALYQRVSFELNSLRLEPHTPLFLVAEKKMKGLLFKGKTCSHLTTTAILKHTMLRRALMCCSVLKGSPVMYSRKLQLANR